MPPNITVWLGQLPDDTITTLAVLGLIVWVLASKRRTRRLVRLLKALRLMAGAAEPSAAGPGV